MLERLKAKRVKLLTGLLLAALVLIGTAWVYDIASIYVKQRQAVRTLDWEVPPSSNLDFTAMDYQKQSVSLAQYGLHFFAQKDDTVYDGKVWGVKDGQGKVVIPAAYESIQIDSQLDYMLCGGTATDGYTYSYRYYNMDGTDMIKGAWADASLFQYGYAYVKASDEYYRIIKPDGTVSFELRCEEFCDFDPAKGRYMFRPYAVADEAMPGWGIIDREGRVLLEPIYEYIKAPSDGKTITARWDDEEGYQKHMYLDADTLHAITGQGYEDAFSYSEGLAVANLRGIKWQVLDLAGQVVAELNCQELHPYAEGISVMKKKDQYFAIDETGKELFKIPCGKESWFDDSSFTMDLSQYSEGLLIFRGKNGNYGYMDKKGNIVVEPVFTYAESFQDGVALVELGNKGGILKNPLKY